MFHFLLASLGIVLPLIRTEFSFSYSQVGLLTFTLGIFPSVASVPMGFVSDQINRLRLISYMFFLIAILAPLLMVARGVFLIFILLGLMWFCTAIFHPASHAHLSHYYSTKRGVVFGLYEAGGSLGMVIAPVLAVAVASLWGWRSIYLIYALPALLLAFRLRWTREKQVHQFGNGKTELTSRFWSELKVSLHSRRLRLIYGIQMAYGCLFSITLYYLPLFAIDLHQWTVSQAGYLLTLFLFGGLLGKFLGGKFSDRWGRYKVIGWSFIILIPLFILLSLAQGWLVLVILSFFAGLISQMILPVIAALIGDYTNENAGLNYGIQDLSGRASAAGASLGFGILADLFNLTVIFQLLSVVSVLGLICIFLLVREKRKSYVFQLRRK